MPDVGALRFVAPFLAVVVAPLGLSSIGSSSSDNFNSSVITGSSFSETCFFVDPGPLPFRLVVVVVFFSSFCSKNVRSLELQKKRKQIFF